MPPSPRCRWWVPVSVCLLSIPFPFRVFIISSLAPPLPPRLGSHICPHREPHGRGRRLGAVALLCLCALCWLGCSTRQRAADFNVLYSCHGPDARLNILSEDELGMTWKMTPNYQSYHRWSSQKSSALSKVKVCQQTDEKTGSPMGLFELPLFPSSLAEQERGRGASEGE